MGLPHGEPETYDIKIKFWVDNGANIHSKRQETVTTKELGITDQEWLELTDEEKDEYIRDMWSDWIDWGYKEV